MSVCGLPRWLNGKESTCNAEVTGDVVRKIPLEIPPGRSSWVRKIPLENEVATHSPGQSSLAGYGPWGNKSVRQDLATEQQQQLSAY